MLIVTRMVLCNAWAPRPRWTLRPRQIRAHAEAERAARIINNPISISTVAQFPTTYAGDRLLTSPRAADVDGHAEPGQSGWFRPSPSHHCRATDRSRSHFRARADDEAHRYLCRYL
jgi:hypothetical protein